MMIGKNFLIDVGLKAIIGKTFEEWKEEILSPPISKIFEDSIKKFKNIKDFEEIKFEHFLKLFYIPDNKYILEDAYWKFRLSEEEKNILYNNFEKILKRDRILIPKNLREFFNIIINNFLERLVIESKKEDWRVWAWKNLVKYTERKILFPKIQHILNINKELDDKEKKRWFRDIPIWFDFQNTRILRRKEIDEIKEKLKKENRHLIIGEPASGKSIVIKYLAYELVHEGNICYFLDLKEGFDWTLYVDDLRNILDKDCYLIIDDCHLDLSNVNQLIGWAKNRKVKLVVCIRKFPEQQSEDFGKEIYDLLESGKHVTVIKLKDFSHEIALWYFENNQEYKKINKMEKTKIASKISREFGKDLWILSWALLSFDEEKKETKIKDIYEKVTKKRFEKLKIKENEFIYNAEDYFYPISVFYQYEIPIYRKFLISELKLENKTIEKIEKAKYIYGNSFLKLSHSSIAKLYLKAIYYKDFYKKNNEINILKKYIKCHPRYSIEVINGLGEFPYLKHDIIKRIVSEIDIKKLAEIIGSSEDLKGIGKCISFITRANPKVGEELLVKVDKGNLAKIIEESGDLWGIKDHVYFITKTDPGTGKELVGKVDKERLIKNIEKSKDLKGIVVCISSITRANPKVGEELWVKVDKGNLAKIIESSKDLESIGLCISSITRVDPRAAEELTEKIDKEKLARTIEKSKDLWGIGDCIQNITEADSKAAEELTEKIDKEKLARTIEESNDLDGIGASIYYITKANEKVQKDLIKKINKEKLIGKIDESEDLGGIRLCISYITISNPKAGEEFFKLIRREKRELIKEYLKEKVIPMKQTLIQDYPKSKQYFYELTKAIEILLKIE